MAEWVDNEVEGLPEGTYKLLLRIIMCSLEQRGTCVMVRSRRLCLGGEPCLALLALDFFS